MDSGEIPRRFGFPPAGVRDPQKLYCRSLGSMDFASTREGRALKFVRLLPVRQTAKDRDRERLSLY
jgi:hypothetical protein